MTEDTRFLLQDLSCYYGQKIAVRNVNLAIPKAGVTAFIGPSGCGKSTILRCLNRMNDVIKDFTLTGKVFLDGRDLYGDTQDPVAVRRRVGMVFQRPNPFPMSVFNNVAYGLRLHFNLSRAELELEVEQALRAVGLWDEVKDRLESPALRLSGGQQQRLCLARALAVKPEVMLFDEPTSALDPVSATKVEELIKELGKKMTVVTVTHNLSQAGRVADFTAFFFKGELVEVAPTVELFTNPREKLTEDYLSGRGF